MKICSKDGRIHSSSRGERTPDTAAFGHRSPVEADGSRQMASMPAFLHTGTSGFPKKAVVSEDEKVLHLEGISIRRVDRLPPTLEFLSLKENQLCAIDAIAGCTRLQFLELAKNRLDQTALSPILSLRYLRELNLSENLISNLGWFPQDSSLSSLEVFDVSSNPLIDLSPAFAAPALRTLRASQTQIEILRCRRCATLEILDVHSSQVLAVESLSLLPAIQELILDNNGLRDVKGIAAHPFLHTLRLSANAVSEAVALRLPLLGTLDFSANRLKVLPAFSGTLCLSSLSIRENSVSSLAPIAHLPNLTFLDASRNAIRQLEACLANSVLKTLQVLLLNGNMLHVPDDVIQTLAKAKGSSLQHLDVRDNPLSFAFYPFQRQLPEMTWDARQSLADLDSAPALDSTEFRALTTLDSLTQSARSEYRAALLSCCPTIRTLDGILVAASEKQEVAKHFSLSDSPRQRSTRRSQPCMVGDMDEVMYCTPQQSLDGSVTTLAYARRVRLVHSPDHDVTLETLEYRSEVREILDPRTAEVAVQVDEASVGISVSRRPSVEGRGQRSPASSRKGSKEASSPGNSRRSSRELASNGRNAVKVDSSGASHLVATGIPPFYKVSQDSEKRPPMSMPSNNLAPLSEASRSRHSTTSSDAVQPRRVLAAFDTNDNLRDSSKCSQYVGLASADPEAPVGWQSCIQPVASIRGEKSQNDGEDGEKSEEWYDEQSDKTGSGDQTQALPLPTFGGPYVQNNPSRAPEHYKLFSGSDSYLRNVWPGPDHIGNGQSIEPGDQNSLPRRVVVHSGLEGQLVIHVDQDVDVKNHAEYSSTAFLRQKLSHFQDHLTLPNDLPITGGRQIPVKQEQDALQRSAERGAYLRHLEAEIAAYQALKHHRQQFHRNVDLHSKVHPQHRSRPQEHDTVTGNVPFHLNLSKGLEPTVCDSSDFTYESRVSNERTVTGNVPSRVKIPHLQHRSRPQHYDTVKDVGNSVKDVDTGVLQPSMKAKTAKTENRTRKAFDEATRTSSDDPKSRPWRSKTPPGGQSEVTEEISEYPRWQRSDVESSSDFSSSKKPGSISANAALVDAFRGAALDLSSDFSSSSSLVEDFHPSRSSGTGKARSTEKAHSNRQTRLDVEFASRVGGNGQSERSRTYKCDEERSTEKARSNRQTRLDQHVEFASRVCSDGQPGRSRTYKCDEARSERQIGEQEMVSRHPRTYAGGDRETVSKHRRNHAGGQIGEQEMVSRHPRTYAGGDRETVSKHRRNHAGGEDTEVAPKSSASSDSSDASSQASERAVRRKPIPSSNHQNVFGRTSSAEPLWQKPLRQSVFGRTSESNDGNARFLTGPLLDFGSSVQPTTSVVSSQSALTAIARAERTVLPGDVLPTAPPCQGIEAMVQQGLAEVSEFSNRTPGVPSEKLRGVAVINTDSPGQIQQDTKCDDQKKEDGLWQAVVAPVSDDTRRQIVELLSQQTWAVPGHSIVFKYTLGRAVQTTVAAAHQCFQTLTTRDAARAGIAADVAYEGRSHRAFFCGDASKMADVISSPFGFGPVFEGKVCLFALDLYQAEALDADKDWTPCLCGASEPQLSGRALVAALALGECHTSSKLLRDVLPPEHLAKGPKGTAPMTTTFEAAYKAGADSVYFPSQGVVALLNPMRALPLFLTEYYRQRVHIGAVASAA